MRNAIICLSVLALVSQPVSAETNKANCALLAPVMATASAGMSGMYTSLATLDFDTMVKEFSGRESEKFEDLVKIKARLLPVFLEYLVALEDAALMMQRCSR